MHIGLVAVRGSVSEFIDAFAEVWPKLEIEPYGQASRDRTSIMAEPTEVSLWGFLRIFTFFLSAMPQMQCGHGLPDRNSAQPHTRRRLCLRLFNGATLSCRDLSAKARIRAIGRSKCEHLTIANHLDDRKARLEPDSS